jgi:hypothetical protein
MVWHRLILVLALALTLGSIAEASVTCIRINETVKYCKDSDTGEGWYEYTF